MRTNKSIPLELPVIPPKNSFILGDCMDYLMLFPPNFFDLAIVDPPYGIERFKKCENETSGIYAQRGTFKKAAAWNNDKPTEAYFNELFRVSKKQIIFGGNNFELPTSEYFLIWDKKQGMPNFARCEYAWVSPSTKMPAKIIEYPIALHNQSEKIHPTQKPVEVYRQILKTYASVGDLILDTHVGSASSLIACVELGFDYVGFEIDKEYYTMAKSRLGRATRKYELFEAV